MQGQHYDSLLVATPDEPTDVDSLIEALRERVRERRASGLYPEGLEHDLDSHFRRISTHRPATYELERLHEKHAALHRFAGFTPARIEVTSHVPGGSAMHALVGKVVSRQVAGVLAQMQEFALQVRDFLDELMVFVQHPHGHAHPDLLGQIEAILDRLTSYERTPDSDAPLALRELNRRIDELVARLEKREFRPWYSNERFEDEFRGTSDEIRERYADLASRFDGVTPVVDLGCGRGEFLELLAARGVEARGVEIDPRLVKSLLARGLDVDHADAVGWLRRAEDASLGGIALIQVIEHLSPQEVVDLVALAHRKVRSGGRVLVETLNPQSLYIYARAFYADPTHDNPVHPAYLEFLFREAGFSNVHIEWRSEPQNGERLRPIEGADDELNENIARLNTLLFGPQDYALVAVR